MKLLGRAKHLRKRIDRFVLPQGDLPTSLAEIHDAIQRRVGRIAGLKPSEAVQKYITAIDSELNRNDLAAVVRSALVETRARAARAMQYRLKHERSRTE